MRYRLVSFDFDGTLADSGDWFLRVMDQLADEFQFRRLREEDREKVRDYDTRAIMKHLGVPIWKLPGIAIRVRALAAQNRDNIRLFAGVAELLLELQERGSQTAIVSSNSEETIRHILGVTNAERVTHYFGGASLLGKASKLKRMLKGCQVKAGEAIYIGDETRDGLAAKEAGIDFGAVSWGYAARTALLRHSPRFCFGSIQEIVPKLSTG